jgi:hypothetical protein
LNHLTFEWDPRKAASNHRKHGVSFDEAATVFMDPLAVAVADPVHDGRLILLGMSSSSRVLVVVHAELDDETIRIISARRATRHERRAYEEGPRT